MTAIAHADTWDRVKRGTPCPICDKPDFCKVSPDGAVAGCMRPDENATTLQHFKVCRTNLGDMYLFRLTDAPRRAPAPPKPKPPKETARDVIADRAVYGFVADFCAASMDAVGRAELVRRFSAAHGPQALTAFQIGYCDGPALVAALAAAGRTGAAIAAGVLRRDGRAVVPSLDGKLVIPYRRGGGVCDLRGSGIKGDPDGTKELSLPGAYAARGVDGLFFNHDALDRLQPGEDLHLAGGAWKTAALHLAGLTAIGTRGESELSEAQLAVISERAPGRIIIHTDSENPKDGQELSAGRRLVLPKAERLATSAPVFIAEPPREPGAPKVDPDSLLRDYGPALVRACAASALPLAAFRLVVGDEATDVPPGIAADVARLGDELRAERAENACSARRLTFADEEGERQVLRITELEEEVAGLRDCLAHPNQTAGGSVPDILAEVQASYARGDTLVQEGVEYARCVQSQAAKTRSAPTIGRALKVIAAGAKVKTLIRTEQIKTPKYEGPAEITYIALDDHARRSKGAGIRLLLPPRPEKKAQGGSRPRITVPRDETFPTAPLRRKVETWEKFFSTGDDRLLDSKLVHQRTDYFTSAGEALTYDEATRFQDEIGLRPAPPPKYRPAPQTRFQVEDIDLRSTRFHPEIGSETPPDEPEPLHGRCYCGKPNLPGKHYCDNHRPGGDAWQAAVGERGYAPYTAGED